MQYVLHRARRGVAAIVLLLICIPLGSVPAGDVQAASLQAAVRPDRQKIGLTDVPHLILVKPTSTATEAQLEMVFGNGYPIASTTTELTASTSNVPSTFAGESVTAWPGVGSTASSVTGHTVTFTSNDLTAGTLYGFYITAGIDTPSTVSSKQVTVRTKTGGGTTIDDEIVFIPFNDSDQVGVAASVAPTGGDLTFALASNTPETVGRAQTLTFTLTYGTVGSAAQSFNVEADWTLGTGAGQESATFTVADYVVGSASSAHGEAAPQVDLENRKITWQVTHMPGDTTKKVTWQLRTMAAMGTDAPIAWQVRGRLTRTNLLLPYEKIGLIYQGATTTSATTARPSLKPTASPTPLPTLDSLQFTSVRLGAISDDSIGWRVQLTKPAWLTVQYTVPGSASSGTWQSAAPSWDHTLTIDSLLADQRYEFSFMARTDTETAHLSEKYLARTASQPTRAVIKIGRSILASRGVTLLSDVHPVDLVAAPVGADLFLEIPFRESPSADVFVHFRSRQVLGISTAFAKTYIERVKLLEVQPGIFSAQLIAPTVPSKYDLVVDIDDIYGNRRQETIVGVQTSLPLRVIDDAGRPLEAAHVLLEWRDPVSHEYVRFPSESVAYANPARSDIKGWLPFVLPSGSFRVSIDTIGYRPLKSEFTFSTYSGQEYPVFTVNRAPFSLVGTLQFYLVIGRDMVTTLGNAADDIAASSRYLRFNILVAAIIASVTSILLIAVLRGFTPRLAQSLKTAPHRQRGILWLIVSAVLHGVGDLLFAGALLLHGVILFKLDFVHGGPLLALTLLNVALWLELKSKHWREHIRSN